MRSRVILYLLISLMALLWGLVFIATKLGGQVMPVSVFTADRYLLGAIAMILITCKQGRWVRVGWRDGLELTALGFVGHGLMQLAFASGIMRTNTGIAALIYGSTPMLVAGLSVMLGMERLQGRQWIGTGLAFLGMVAVVVAGARSGFTGQSTCGDLLVFVATLCMAIYTIWSRRLLARLDLMFVMSWVLGVGALVTLVWSIPDQSVTLYRTLPPAGWWLLLYGAVFALTVPNLIFLKGVREIGRARTSLFINAVPMIGCVAGWLILGEQLGGIQLVGGVLIVCGIVMAQTARGLK